MNKMTNLLSVLLLCSFCQAAFSEASINDMQKCQGLLDFLEIKLKDSPSTYPKDKVEKVRDGLNQYNRYIQKEIITPGLLKFNGGNASKAESMQLQINIYKANITKGLSSHDRSTGLVTDYAISVNNCAKKSVPSGGALEKLKYVINTMVELAQIN